MQRRAAAAYFLFFLVLSIGAYSMNTMAKVPAARSDGLMAVTVMSALTAILLLGLSYLPVRG